MDFYSYYKERFTWGHNPNESIAQCQRTVMEMMNSHIIPLRIAAESAVGYLAALYDSAGDGFTVSFPFRITMNALINALQRAYDAVEAADKEWAKEMMEAERADGNGPPYEPDDYVVQDIDLDSEEPDEDEAEAECTDPEEFYNAVKELYGTGGETGTTGTRRPFPDWAHIDQWTPGDWVMLQTYKDKVLAASEHGFMAISSVAGVLAAAKDAMCRVPLPRQVELALWAQEVVDRLMVSIEDDLQEMCAGSLHSHAGRLVQKHLISDTRAAPPK